MKKFISTTLVIFISTSAVAQTSAPEITELRWVDEGQLQRQRGLVEELTKMEFGAPLRGNRSDLRSLDRIIENDYVSQVDIEMQQALGVVLGDVFVQELGLAWVVYKDAEGESRATCIPNTEHCLFPVTMLSKRMRLGVKPQASAMFERGKELLEPYFPRLPYTVKK